MEINIVKTIAAALKAAPFREAYRSNCTLNAIEALSGITHYCDASTLRFHRSRIVGASIASCGAFYKVTETCAQDYENTVRGYRVVLFDLTGEAVYRPDLSELTRTKKQADKAFYEWFNQFDGLNHYREKINYIADKKAQESTLLKEVSRVLAVKSETTNA